MSEQADIGVDETPDSQPAEDQEPRIPKYRLDELSARLRAAEERNQILTETLQTLRPQGQQRPEEDDQEILQHLDPNQVRAVEKLLKKQLKEVEHRYGGVIGNLGNKVDEQNFLLEYGKEKKAYLPKMRQMQRDYAARGTWLDLPTIYKLIVVDEMESRPAPKKEAAKAEKVVKVEAEETPPPAAASHQKAQPKTKSIEELEAELDERIRSSGMTI